MRYRVIQGCYARRVISFIAKTFVSFRCQQSLWGGTTRVTPRRHERKARAPRLQIASSRNMCTRDINNCDRHGPWRH